MKNAKGKQDQPQKPAGSPLSIYHSDTKKRVYSLEWLKIQQEAYIEWYKSVIELTGASCNDKVINDLKENKTRNEKIKLIGKDLMDTYKDRLKECLIEKGSYLPADIFLGITEYVAVDKIAVVRKPSEKDPDEKEWKRESFKTYADLLKSNDLDTKGWTDAFFVILMVPKALWNPPAKKEKNGNIPISPYKKYTTVKVDYVISDFDYVNGFKLNQGLQLDMTEWKVVETYDDVPDKNSKETDKTIRFYKRKLVSN